MEAVGSGIERQRAAEVLHCEVVGLGRRLQKLGDVVGVAELAEAFAQHGAFRLNNTLRCHFGRGTRRWPLGRSTGHHPKRENEKENRNAQLVSSDQSAGFPDPWRRVV